MIIAAIVPTNVTIMQGKKTSVGSDAFCAARGMMVSTMTTYGPDSFASKLSGIFQGASDTTFYVVAVYFGSVSIKNTRYSIGVMLLADLVGIITAIFLAYLFFGNGL